MYSPTAEAIAHAFDLGQPRRDLALVRRGDTDAWRLDTEQGSYLVKGYWPTTGGQFADGGLIDQLDVAMAFERRALEAGIDMGEPIAPVDPLLGWVVSLNARLFRVYRWVEHRELRPEDDVADWLGQTMARVHQLQPLNRVGLPEWWRAAVWAGESWDEWIAEAYRRTKYWSGSAVETLPRILELSARIAKVGEVASDNVMTHGDFKTHNVLKTETGQVLVDWDSVRVDSAALEAGRAAYIFGAGEEESIRRILGAYKDAGGDIGWVGDDLFLSVARRDLQGLFEWVQVSLGRMAAPRWMEDSEAVERSIGELLVELPGKLDRLTALARKF